MEFRARRNGIEFAIRAVSAELGFITTNPTRLRQTPTNVVGNAVKFTDRGTVNVLFRTDGSTMFIRAKDTVRGISE